MWQTHCTKQKYHSCCDVSSHAIHPLLEKLRLFISQVVSYVVRLKVLVMIVPSIDWQTCTTVISDLCCCRPVEENVDFLTDLEKAAEGKGVIVMCEAGGTMKPSPNFASGKASRSLKVRHRFLLSVLMQLLRWISYFCKTVFTVAISADTQCRMLLPIIIVNATLLK